MRRRSAANQQAAGVSLFPFLAVLLCTMGALIVVLVVIARHARLQVAAAAKQAEADAAKSDFAMAREDLEWRISELTKSRDATKKMLDDKQLELSHIEEHTRRIRDKLEELAGAKEHFNEMAAGDAKEIDDLKARLARLQQDAELTRRQIADLRGKAGPGTDSYAIIPYHGPNETHRRPIYVECRAEGVVLQPEGIVLTADDFAVDIGPSNPLVSALRAARDYHARNQLMHRTEATTPYPLFIIRPDGIEMSYYARAAMISWGPEFGYELVGQDWPLEYPPPDKMLALAMKQAVSEGRMQQAFIARAAPSLSRTHGGGRFRASSHGGIVQVEGSGGNARRGSGRPRGVPSRNGNGGGQVGAGSGSGNYLGSGSNNNSASGEGPVHSIDGSDNPYESALASSAGGYGPGGTALAGNATGQSGGRYGATPGGGYLPGPGTGPTNIGPSGLGNGYGQSARFGNGFAGGPMPGSGNGHTLASTGNGNGSAAGTSPTFDGGTATGGRTGDSLRGNGTGNGNGIGEGNVPGGRSGSGTGTGKAGGTQLAQANPAGGGSGMPGGSLFPSGVGDGTGATGRGGSGLSAGPANASSGYRSGQAPGGSGNASGTDGSLRGGGAVGQGTAPGTNALAGGPGTGGGTVGKLPANTGATAPGGPYRTAASSANTPVGNTSGTNASSTNSPGASGPGNSDVAGDSSDNPSTDGVNAPASPNGFAGGRIVNNGQTSTQGGPSSRSGVAGGSSNNGSSSPTVLSESRNAAGGTAGASGASGSRTKMRGQMAGGQAGGSSSSSSSSSSAGQSSAFGGSASAMQSPQMGGLPSPNLNFGQQNQQAPESLAKKRDRNWANPDASTSNVPIERPIRIVCDAEHLTLLAEGRGRQGMRIIPFKPRTVDSVDELVATVWDRIDSWGTAGRGMYWRPVLLMEVEPGGQRRYAELQALLAESGFDVHGKPRRHIFAAPRTTPSSGVSR